MHNFVEVPTFTLTVPNTPGQLLKITELLKTENINITSLSSHVIDDIGLIRFTAVASPADVTRLLATKGLVPVMTPAIGVFVPNTPGALNELTSYLVSEKINISNIYATVIPEQTTDALIVLSMERTVDGVVPTKALLEKFFAKQPVAA